MSNISIQHKTTECSTKKQKIIPVAICVQILTRTVMTKMLSAVMFAYDSNSPLVPIEEIMKPIATHIKTVPVSLDNWS
ncbi:hypothetical protein ACHQM5_006512 [Ranunculus cassubicifolius]